MSFLILTYMHDKGNKKHSKAQFFSAPSTLRIVKQSSEGETVRAILKK